MNSHARLGVVAASLVGFLVSSMAIVPAGAGAGAAAVDAPAGAKECPVDSAYQVSTGAASSLPGADAFENTLLRHIDNTPSGAYIRVATWAFTSTRLSNELIAAHNCGVVVRVLLPKMSGWRSSAVNDLIGELGRNKAKNSFVKVTSHSSRGPDRFDGTLTTMHQKSWQFSTTGASSKVTVITSSNATMSATDNQATDSFTWDGSVADGSGIYDFVRDMYAVQVQDVVDPSPYVRKVIGGTTLFYSPWNKPSMGDPVVARIQGLPGGSMTIRIAMASWSGPRGERIADALAAKASAARAQGKKVGIFVLAGKPTWTSVLSRLRGAGAVICNGKVSETNYLHSKFMTARYVRGGQTQYATGSGSGSENWSDAARGVDELGFRVDGKGPYIDYLNYFNAATDHFDPSCAYR